MTKEKYTPFYKSKFSFKHLMGDIRCCYQRIKYGYCERDVWDVFDWFLTIMPNILEDLKNLKNSYPYDMQPEEWDEVLDTMIKNLREADEMKCSWMNPYEKEFEKMLSEKRQDDEIREKFFARNKEISDYRDRCKDKALTLFTKHFWDLWD